MKYYLDGRFEAWYENGERKLKCGYCGQTVNRSVVPHLKKYHPSIWKDWRNQFLKFRSEGLSYKQIMNKFDTLFSWTIIERETTQMLTEQDIPIKSVEIKQWEPSDFHLEETTRWSFSKRGNWANHTGEYRGNWAPQIPRNLILRYTRRNELVLDPFVGGGTTLIECMLLGRNGIGLDINPFAVKLASYRVKELKETAIQRSFRLPEVMIEVRQGDARDLRFIEDETIDFVCTHPPYGNAIRYTNGIAADLSQINDEKIFLKEMNKVAGEIYRVLKRGKKCAVLIGDTRKNGLTIPLGFSTMKEFLDNGFKTQEVVIKDQHQCMTNQFWTGKREFLRLAHEYLFLFTK